MRRCRHDSVRALGRLGEDVNATPSAPGGPSATAGSRRRSVLTLLLLGALVVALRWLPLGDWLAAFRAWAQVQGTLGQIAFALVYAVCVVLFVPASVLTLGAGAVYGLGRGVVVVVAGASLGALASFLLARGVLRSRVQRWVAGSPRLRALDGAVARSGARIVFLVRLSPAFPFTLSNYVFGLTGVSPAGYAVATIIGMIPGAIAWVYLGVAGADAAAGGVQSGVELALRLGGVISALADTELIARLAMRAIRAAGVDEGA